MKNIFFTIALVILVAAPLRGQWKPTKGPFGGNIWALAINQNGEILAGTENHFLYRSTDDGISWTQASTYGLTDGAGNINAILIKSNGYIFLGTGWNGILRSTDKGKSWSYQDNGLTPKRPATSANVYALIETSDGNILMSNDTGIYRSSDDGNSWHELTNGLPHNWFNSLIVDRNGNIFAVDGYDGTVFRSQDKGNSWSKSNSGLFLPAGVLAVDSSNNLYAGTGDITGKGGMFRSTDNGVTWIHLLWGSVNSRVKTLAIDKNGNIFAGTDYPGIFRSTNQGNTWTQIDSELTTPSILSLAINAKGEIFAGSYGGGVFYSIDSGNSWQAPNTNLRNTSIYGFGLSPNGLLFASTNAGVFSSSDNGDSWRITEVQGVSFAFKKDGVGFATGSGVYRTKDSGNSWEKLKGNDYVLSATSIAINSKGEILASTNADGSPSIFISKDDGDTWTASSGIKTNNHIRAIAINSSDIVFAAGQDGLFRSTDDGGTWEEIDNGIPNKYILSLAINSKGDIIAGSFDFGIYRSVDNGNTWQLTDTIGLPFWSEFWAITMDSKDNLFVASSSGVFFSTNSGALWKLENNGLGGNVETIQAANGYIFVGTFNDGVYRASLSDFGINKVSLPLQHLDPALYPNPSDGMITIETSEPTTKLRIFDELGKEIDMLVSNIHIEPCAVKIDIHSLSSGVYFCNVGGRSVKFIKSEP